jgi:hypothetical protein
MLANGVSILPGQAGLRRFDFVDVRSFRGLLKRARFGFFARRPRFGLAV